MARRKMSQLQTATARFLVDRSDSHRDRLVELLLPWIQSLARREKGRMATQLDIDDLAQHGVLGLIDALRRYDGHTTVQTFAVRRVVGAMIDATRADSPVSRLHASRYRGFKAAADKLAQELGRRPSTGEIEAAAEIDPRQAAELRCSGSLLRPVNVVPTESDVHAPPIDETAEDPASKERRRQILKIVMQGLDTRERICLSEYFFADQTMKNIAKGVGLSESRVSQMMSAAMERLRERLSDERSELFELARSA